MEDFSKFGNNQFSLGTNDVCYVALVPKNYKKYLHSHPTPLSGRVWR